MSALRILRLPAVEAKSGIKRDAIYAGAKDGTFPRPVKLTPRASGWIENEIDEWIRARADARRSVA